jgi:hypothetical protein
VWYAPTYATLFKFQYDDDDDNDDDNDAAADDNNNNKYKCFSVIILYNENMYTS